MRGVCTAALLAGATVTAVCAAPTPDRVTFSLHKAPAATNFIIRWQYPVRMQGVFGAAASDDERTAVGIAEMRKQEAAGCRTSAFELGFLHLYGIGMTQNLAEAEVRLRGGLELGHPEGVYWLADALTRRMVAERDLPTAAELTLEALGAGHAPAIPLGLWLAEMREHPPRKWRDRDRGAARLVQPERAEEILEAVLEIKPDRADALLKLTELKYEQKQYRDAWDLAEKVLAAPALTEQEYVRARLLRVAVAQKAGKTAELGVEDVREIVKVLSRGRGRIIGFIGATVGLLVSIAVVTLWVWLTRRRAARGPGWFVIGGWIGLHALIFGFGILHPVSAAATGAFLAAAVGLSLGPALRPRLFPAWRWAPFRERLRAAAALVGGVALILAFNAAYEAVYTRWTGHPPDLQLVAAFLRTDNARDLALVLFGAAVCIPFIEEVVFRGFLVDWLRRRLLPWPAVVVGAVVFGLIHGLVAALPIAVIGLVAGWLRLRSGGLWLPILLHGAINATAILML